MKKYRKASQDKVPDVLMACKVKPSDEVSRIREGLMREQGPRARIWPEKSLHMTVIGGLLVREQFLLEGCSPQHATGKAKEWNGEFAKRFPWLEQRVPVNQKNPFVLIGYEGRKLALNLDVTPELDHVRTQAELLLDAEFDDMPLLGSFRPHVTFAEVGLSALTHQVRAEPLRLLPDNFVVPDAVSIYGVRAYLHSIEADTDALLSEAA